MTRCLAFLALFAAGCGPQVSVHFQDEATFSVTSTGDAVEIAALEAIADSEADFICQSSGADGVEHLGELDCDYGRDTCYAAMYSCDGISGLDLRR